MSEVSPETRPLIERAVRRRMAPFTLFLVRLRRKGRRWEVEEAVAPFNPSDRQSLDELRALVEATAGRWAPVGTHAQVMGLAWRVGLMIGSPRPHDDQRLAALRALVRGDPESKLQDAQHPREAHWLYPVVKKGSIRFGWVFSRVAAHDAVMPHAVSLSAVMGRLSGRLLLCRFCEAAFLAAYKWDRACKNCQQARATARRPDVTRVLADYAKSRKGDRSCERPRWLTLLCSPSPTGKRSGTRGTPLGGDAPQVVDKKSGGDHGESGREKANAHPARGGVNYGSARGG